MKNCAKKFLNYVKALSFVGVLLGVVHFSFGQELEMGESSASKLRWSQIRTTGTVHEQYGATIGLTLNKKIYTWGGNFYYEIHTAPYANSTTPYSYTLGGVTQSTPYFVPTPVGETAKKVFTMDVSSLASNSSQVVGGNAFICLMESGKVYAWGVNNGCFGNAWTITSTPYPVDTNAVKRVPTLVTVPNETNIVDMAVPNTGGWMVLIASSGKAYFNGSYGGLSSTGSKIGYTNFPQIPFPAGVTTATFKYTQAWVHENTVAATEIPVLVYLKGNDNKIYVTGDLRRNIWGAGSPAAAVIEQATGHDVWDIRTKIPTVVPFPSGEEVVKIVTTPYSGSATMSPADIAVALTASGKAFAGGAWYFKGQSPSYEYDRFYFFPVKNQPTGPLPKRRAASLSDTLFYIPTFTEVPLPVGVNATKFIDVAIPPTTIYPGVSMYFVTDNNYVYWSGKNQEAYLYLQNSFVHDSWDPLCKFNRYFASTSSTLLNVEAVNLKGTAKIFCGYETNFLIAPSGRGYVFGQFRGTLYAAAGIGRQNSGRSVEFPTPISNELLDTCNPRPGNGDGGGTSTASPAVGTIDCSKTQIVAAPVSGTPSQHALVVTVNVTTAGSFSPLSVSGSGMSLANGVTSVTTALTGVQQFQIPINYDGTALTNNFQFTIGSAGSCTADLTLQSKKVVKNVFTLQNCTAITPGTLSK